MLPRCDTCDWLAQFHEVMFIDTLSPRCILEVERSKIKGQGSENVEIVFGTNFAACTCKNVYIFTIWALCWMRRSPTLGRFIYRVSVYKIAVANQGIGDSEVSDDTILLLRLVNVILR